MARIAEKARRAAKRTGAKKELFLGGIGVNRQGDSIYLMNALRKIDSINGTLSNGELHDAASLTEHIVRKSAIRQVEADCGKKLVSGDEEMNAIILYQKAANRKELLGMLMHGNEIGKFILRRKK